MTVPKAPSPAQYERERVSLALAHAPHIYACKTCQWPVLSGYVCTYCGSQNPREKPEAAA